MQEVSTLHMLRHRNIVQFYGACLEPDCFFIVTELMQGASSFCQSLRWAAQQVLGKTRPQLRLCVRVIFVRHAHHILVGQLGRTRMQSKLRRVCKPGLACMTRSGSRPTSLVLLDWWLLSCRQRRMQLLLLLTAAEVSQSYEHVQVGMCTAR